MDEKMQRFFLKNRIIEQEIMYIVRQNQRTEVHLKDGRIISTYIPAKTIVKCFEKDTFLNINKGIFLNVNFILYVDQEIYTMKDCSEFCGRSRSTNKQRTIKNKLVKSHSHSDIHNIIKSKFNILDKCPVPFCIFEDDNQTNQYIIRYLNQAMNQTNNNYQLGKDLLSLISLSQDQIQTIRRVLDTDSQESIETDRYKIYCYRPLKNYGSFLFFKK